MLSPVRHDSLDRRGIQLWILHDNALPGSASGSKRYKLQPFIQTALDAGHDQILSFGGAYSNHIHALAYAARAAGLASVGIIRGEHEYRSNPTLHDATQTGMALEFVTRQEYRSRHDRAWLDQLQRRYPDALIVPEGGSNVSAARECASILDSVDNEFLGSVDILACAAGTGATFCGLHSRLIKPQQARAYAVVNDPHTKKRIENWVGQLSAFESAAEWLLVPSIDAGYAKLSVEQCQFVETFLQQTGILLDPVYTMKMVKQLIHETEQGEFADGTTILAVHTGGLQGWRGLIDKARACMHGSTVDTIHRLTNRCLENPD